MIHTNPIIGIRTAAKLTQQHLTEHFNFDKTCGMLHLHSFHLGCHCLMSFSNHMTLLFTHKIISIPPFTPDSAFIQMNCWMSDVRISKLWWRTQHSKWLSRVFLTLNLTQTTGAHRQSYAFVDALHWPIFTLGCYVMDTEGPWGIGTEKRNNKK